MAPRGRRLGLASVVRAMAPAARSLAHSSLLLAAFETRQEGLPQPLTKSCQHLTSLTDLKIPAFSSPQMKRKKSHRASILPG